MNDVIVTEVAAGACMTHYVHMSSDHAKQVDLPGAVVIPDPLFAGRIIAVGAPKELSFYVYWTRYVWVPRVTVRPTWGELLDSAQKEAWAEAGQCGTRILRANGRPLQRLAATLVLAGERHLAHWQEPITHPNGWGDRDLALKRTCTRLDAAGSLVPPSLWDARGVSFPPLI